jgi:p-aminobenzoyl-glutamate transporter AbgT
MLPYGFILAIMWTLSLVSRYLLDIPLGSDSQVHVRAGSGAARASWLNCER